MAQKTGRTQEEYLQNPKAFEQEIKIIIRNNLKGKILGDDGKTLKKDLPIAYPKCMKKYIEDSLDTWIENVIKAPTMIEEKDFIKKDNNIVPIDYSNTGVLQNNMVWDGGLQQILQIIHDENGTYENENTNFLSNISFFKRYNGNIYGVTGTFGGKNFQDILKEVYEIKLYKIPPNKDSLLHSITPKICKNKDEYFDEIKKNIENIIIEQNRSVLVICNSINEGKELYEEL
jgi:CRISPR/Cas system-associated endonuclease/helicase Cas3